MDTASHWPKVYVIFTGSESISWLGCSVTEVLPLNVRAASCVGSIAWVAAAVRATASRADPIVMGVVPKNFEKCTRSSVAPMVGRIIKRKLCSFPPGSSELDKAFCGDAPQATTHCESAGADDTGGGACEREKPTKDVSMTSPTTDNQRKDFTILKTCHSEKKFTRKRYRESDPEL